MLGFFLLVGLIILVVTLIAVLSWEQYGFGMIILPLWLTAFSVVLGGVINDTFFPTAIDVYRNRTELQINKQTTGRVTIIKDSMVVFKPEFK